MTRRVLIAGVGNIFLGDDGFGVEVVRRLSARPLPDGCEVIDFGIRGLHLAHKLLEHYDLLILIDAVSRQGAPGTVYLLAPDTQSDPATHAGGHSLDLPSVFASVRALGGVMPPTLLIGCEPLDLSENLGLSEPVEQAVDEAVRKVEEWLSRTALDIAVSA